MYRLILSLLVFASSFASGEVLFEGFYRIERADKHLGYVVQRVSQNGDTRNQVTLVFLEQNGSKTVETFKSSAKVGSLAPIESVHGGDRDGSTKEIVGVFPATGKPYVDIRNPKGRRADARTFLDPKLNKLQSTFLFYAADLGKLVKGKNYSFDVYMERLGRSAYGQMSVEGETMAGGQRVQHLVLDLGGETTENFVALNGDALGSRSPSQDIIAFWVKTKEEAVGLFEYPSSEMIALFGDLPEGRKNPWFGLSGFNAKNTVKVFRKSFGFRKLAMKERDKITSPLPLRVK